MKRYVIGDIHGAYKAMVDVLLKAKFNPKEDMLFAVGDYVDGYPDSFKVIEYLSNLPHFQGVLGNHDFWFLDYLLGGGSKTPDYSWIDQGGLSTINSYKFSTEEQVKKHESFLRGLPIKLKIENTLIVHGGLGSSGEFLSNEDFLWDRGMYLEFKEAQEKGIDISLPVEFSRVITGHTPTARNKSKNWEPFHYKGFWDIDQGAGYNGKLTLIDFDTETVYQSKHLSYFYKKNQGRL